MVFISLVNTSTAMRGVNMFGSFAIMVEIIRSQRGMASFPCRASGRRLIVGYLRVQGGQKEDAPM